MSTWVNVSRYHMADRITFTVMPLGVLAFTFSAALAFTAAIPPSILGKGTVIGMSFGFYTAFGALGGVSIFRMLPFGLALGVSRRSYYIGTTLLCIGLAAGYGLMIAVLQAIEGATGGWGIAMHLFRVPYFLAGPWTLTWLTSSVCMTLLAAYGMWFGIIYWRWNVAGLLVSVGSQIIAVLTAILIIVRTHAGPHLAHAFTRLTPAGATGLLALLAAALLVGGYASIRRATV